MKTDGTSAFGVYAHIPFCRSKCRYCDFNSYVGREWLIDAYMEALTREMAAASVGAAGAAARTLYIGGGTPSLLPARHVASLVRRCREVLGLAEDAEVTLEVNPGTTGPRYFSELREAGFNRLSLGVQSFDDCALRFLGRIHTAAQALAAYTEARRAGFDEVNIDLMYALPGQTREDWLADLRRAVALAPDHLSLYALSVEEGTPLAAMVAAGEVQGPCGDEAAAFYELAEDVLAEADYYHYEIANWARRRETASAATCCRHNLGYWRNEPYLGLGAGAHSFFGGYRYRNEPDPEAYVELVAATGRAAVEVAEVDARRGAQDALMMGLRLAEGIDLDAFAARWGVDLGALCAQQLVELAQLGLLRREGSTVSLTRKGRLLANEALLCLLPKLQSG